MTECERWCGSESTTAESWSLACQGDSLQVSLQRVCVYRIPVAITTSSSQNVWVCIGGRQGAVTMLGYFCMSLTVRVGVHMHTHYLHVGSVWCLCVHLPDPASAGARRGSRRDICQGAELWHHFTGERKDHRAGVQEPAIFSAAEGRQCHTG